MPRAPSEESDAALKLVPRPTVRKTVRRGDPDFTFSVPWQVLESGFKMDASTACRQVINQSKMSKDKWESFTRSVRKRVALLLDKLDVQTPLESPAFQSRMAAFTQPCATPHSLP